MILLRSVKVVFPNSSYNGKTVDILIENGKVKSIASKLDIKKKVQEINVKGLHLSPGFVELNAYIGEPGLEQKETVSSACASAASGGFTHFCVMPNLIPTTSSKSNIEFLIQKSVPFAAKLLPVGAATQNTDGKDLADIYDMHQSGAVAFSDGYKSISTAGMLERALLYTKPINSVVMQHPEDKSIAKNGVMNEGIVSTQLGLPGLPGIAEEIIVARDLSVLEYTGGKLHFNDVSLKQSVNLIQTAKKKKLQVTASCNAYNLILTDETVGDYDTNAKVNPPLRTKADVKALIAGLKEGTIDCITAQHHPQDEECKKLEFDKADFGMIGFETLFAICNTVLSKDLELQKIIELIAINPRKVLSLPALELKEGANADFALFVPNEKWTFAESDIKSRSKNTPFIGKEFIGKVLGIIHGEKSFFNNLK
jgi:dihydroorotase